MSKEIKIAEADYPILDVIRSRWSPRVFSKREITDTDLRQLFEAARWAASSNNYQPWRFIITREGSEGYQKIMDCLSPFNVGWVQSPILVLAGYKEAFDNGKMNFHALHDLGLALGNLSIQAESMGIALHHMAGLDWKKSHELFDIPEGYHMATAIAIGYYGGDESKLSDDLQKSENTRRSRNSQNEFVFYDQWVKTSE